MNWTPLVNFLKDQGPVILVLLYSYMNGKIIRAEQAQKTDDLHKAIEANHAKVESRFAGLTSAGVIDVVIGGGDTSSSGGSASSSGAPAI